MSSLTALGESIAEAPHRPLSPDTVDRCRRHVLDALTCVGASRGVPGGDIPVAVAPRLAGAGDSTVLFSGGVTGGAAGVAFANAQRSVSLDLGSNLYYSQGLPGLVVLPALAVGETIGATGADLLDAVAYGLEAGARVALSLPPPYRLSADGQQVEGLKAPRSRWIAFGGAAALARLLRLGPRETAHALALAGGAAPLPPGHSLLGGGNDAMAKYGLTGAMAFNAVAGALLAADGFTGDLGLLDEDGGFYAALGTVRHDPKPLGDPFGERWAMAEANFKRFPSGTHNQQALHAFAELWPTLDARPDEIEEIRVGRAIGLNPLFTNPRPTNYVAAQFSLAYGLAMVALGKAPAEWSRYVDDPAVEPVARRVVLERDGVAQFASVAIDGAVRSPWRLDTRLRVSVRGERHDVWSSYGEVGFDELARKCAGYLVHSGSTVTAVDRIVDEVRALGDAPVSRLTEAAA